MLEIRVPDSGVGFGAAATGGTAWVWRTRARLAAIHGDVAELIFLANEPSGVIAWIGYRWWLCPLPADPMLAEPRHDGRSSAPDGADRRRRAAVAPGDRGASAQAVARLDIVAQTDDGVDALRLLTLHRPIVMFLDIQMPGLSGLEVAKQAAGRSHCAFVTAYDQYAIAAFDQGAVDYVMKRWACHVLRRQCSG